MTIRHRIAALVLSALVPSAAMAQSSLRLRARPHRRRRAEGITFPGRPPDLPGRRGPARHRARGRYRRRPSRRPGRSPGDLVETKGPLVFFRQAPVGTTAPARLAAAATVAPVEGGATFPVVVNTVSGQLGARPGTLR